jgi:hypothetical protein
VNTYANKELILCEKITFEKALPGFDRAEYEPGDSQCGSGLLMKNHEKAITGFALSTETGKELSLKNFYAPFYFKKKAEAEAFVNHSKNL